MSREAMKQALEALESDPISHAGLVNRKQAIIALRQALETEREWIGLTVDEIWKCNKSKSGSAVEFHICYEHQNVLDFAEAIEAKLKEKNT
jgi:predicted metal-dependent hydrolase